MKFREHRGQLADSMATCVELADRAALIEHVTVLHDCYIHGHDFSQLKIEAYDERPDLRIGWPKTYIVTLKGYGVIGFTDSAEEQP